MTKKIILKILISAVLIGYLLYKVNMSELLYSLKNVNLLFILIAYGSLIFGNLICSYKWMILLRAQNINEPSFVRLWCLYYIGGFFNNFLPTEVGGDIIRSYKVGKVSGEQVKSFAAVVMDRFTGLMAVVFYALIGLILNWSIASDLNLAYLVIGSISILVIVISLISNRSFAKLIQRKVTFKLINKMLDKLKSLYEAFYLYRENLIVFIKSIIISLIFQIYLIWLIMILMKSIHLEPSFIQLMLIVPTITLICILPISINSLGLREGAYVFFFTFIGISTSQALTLALLYRFATLLSSSVGGVLYTTNFYELKNVKSKKMINSYR
jgi:uncharacterized protein (TIRG00374 family)